MIYEWLTEDKVKIVTNYIYSKYKANVSYNLDTEMKMFTFEMNGSFIQVLYKKMIP